MESWTISTRVALRRGERGPGSQDYRRHVWTVRRRALVCGLGKYRGTATRGPLVHVKVRGYRTRWGPLGGPRSRPELGGEHTGFPAFCADQGDERTIPEIFADQFSLLFAYAQKSLTPQISHG